MTFKVHVIETTSDPIAAPDFVGQHWVNTASSRQWLASGTSSVSDWGEVFTSVVLNEQIRDTIGTALTDSASIDFTANDPGDTISASVIPGGVDHNGLANLTTGNPHTQYLLSSTAATTYQPLDGDLTAVAALAGTGLVTRTASNTMTTRTLTAGTGITVTNGDGVSGNPTAAITNTGVTAATYGSATQVAQVAINAQGQATSASNVAIAIPSTQVTDFTEAVQDVMGGALTDSSTVDFVYNDVSNTQTANVIPGGINHNLLLNGGGNTHIDHSTVSIIAGTYLTGGGDITASRTVNHANSAVTPGSYGGVNAIPVLTVGATGHVDAASTVNTTSAVLTGFSAAAGTVVATDTILQAFQKIQGTITAGVASFAADVRNTILTGISFATNTAVTASDSILVGMGKLQAQINDLIATDNQWYELETTADIIVNSNVTLTNVTELGIPVVAGNRYYLEYTIMFRTAATTTGFAITLGTNDGAAGTLSALVNMPIAADGTAAGYTGSITAFDDVVTGTGVQTTQPTWFICNVKGSFQCTTGGTLLPKFRSEVNGSNVNFGKASFVLAREFA